MKQDRKWFSCRSPQNCTSSASLKEPSKTLTTFNKKFRWKTSSTKWWKLTSYRTRGTRWTFLHRKKTKTSSRGSSTVRIEKKRLRWSSMALIRSLWWSWQRRRWRKSSGLNSSTSMHLAKKRSRMIQDQPHRRHLPLKIESLKSLKRWALSRS